MATVSAAEIDFIEAPVHFVHPIHRGFRAPNQYTAASKSQLKRLGAREHVRVYNARLLDPPPTLSEHGFQLVRAPTKLDLLDNEVVKKQHYEECRALLREVAGTEQVLRGAHEYRNGFGGLPAGDPRAARATPNGSGGNYATGVHSDMCAMIEDGFKKLTRHFENLNVWRSTDKHRNVSMMPLALCDMRTVDPADIVFGDGTDTGDVRQFKKVVDQKIIHNPCQRWYYFPQMTPDEVLVFRQYDTRQEALNLRTVFHQAVADPTTPEDAPMRSSIEVRMTALHGIESDKAARVARFKAQISTRYADGRPCSWFRGPIESYRPPAQVVSKL